MLGQAMLARAPAARPRRRRLRGLLRRGIVLGALALVAWSWLARTPIGPAVHPDRSEVSSGAQPAVAREVLVTVRDADGRIRHALADAAAVSAFVRREAAALETERLEALAAAGTDLDARTRAIFAGMSARVEDFADWYFAWTTSYRLAGRAAVSAFGALVDPRVEDIAESVGADVERYVEARYRSLVMQPELTDPALAEAFSRSLELLHARFASSVERFDRQLRAFLATHTRHLEPHAAAHARLALDWDAQTARLTLAGFERGTLESGRSLALGLTGAAAGRAAGAGLARAAAGRLGAPFVTRGVATATGAAAGTVGGVVGALAGAAVGLGADWLINEGVELWRRPELEVTVRELVVLQELQWSEAMHAALEEASRAWYGDLVESLARTDPR